MTLRIRQATGADSTLLSELGYRIYPAHFQHLWVSDAEMKDFLDAEYTLPSLSRACPRAMFPGLWQKPIGQWDL